MRKTWEEYFMENALLASTMSTCLRRNVGAIVVREKRILATGFNGQISGGKHCEECFRIKENIPSGQMLDRCKAVHAEANAIAQCASNGISCKGAILVVTHKPCFTCFKLAANSGISSILWNEEYPDKLTNEAMEEIGVLSKERFYGWKKTS
jgi:dCMP deaminase